MVLNPPTIGTLPIRKYRSGVRNRKLEMKAYFGILGSNISFAKGFNQDLQELDDFRI